MAKKLIIDKAQFALGISTTEMSEDGGYSPESAGFNLFQDEFADVLTPSEFGTEVTGYNDSYGILDIVKNESLVSGAEFFYCDENGKHSKVDGTTITQVYDDSDDASDYANTYVNMIHYQNSFYTTKRQDIVQANHDYSVVDDNWFNTKTGNSLESYPHPMEVVEGILYIGDHAHIHIWDNTTFQEDAMDFGQYQVITEIIAHPNGRDLMVFTEEGGLITRGQARVYYVDLLTMEFYSEMKIDFPVDVAKIVSGTIFVAGNRQGRDNYFGTFDGVKVEKIDHSEVYKTTYIYQRNMAKFGRFLMLPARQETTEASLLAFGKVKGSSRFFKPWRKEFDTDTYVIEAITEYDASRLLIFYHNTDDSTRTARRIDFTETDNADIYQFRMYSNRMKEAQKSWVRRVDVYFEQKLESGQGKNFFIKNWSNATDKDSATSLHLGDFTYTQDGANNWKRFDCNIYTDDFQIFFTEDASSNKRVKIKRIEIYLEGDE